MAYPVVKQHPLGWSWTIVRFGVVYGREESLEGDGFCGGEKGHWGGEGEVVVVIEQVVLCKIRIRNGLADGFEIVSELNFAYSAVLLANITVILLLCTPLISILPPSIFGGERDYKQ